MLIEFVQKNKKIITIFISLICVALVCFAIYLIATNPQKTESQTKATFVSKNPIVKLLPYKDPYFTISYKTMESSSNDIVVTIHTPSPRYRYAALRQFRAFGYDPTDYKIEFSDYISPLEGTR